MFLVALSLHMIQLILFYYDSILYCGLHELFLGQGMMDYKCLFCDNGDANILDPLYHLKITQVFDVSGRDKLDGKRSCFRYVSNRKSK